LSLYLSKIKSWNKSKENAKEKFVSKLKNYSHYIN
jgi:hypothetical protein